MQPKATENKAMWAVFDEAGYIVLKTIATTKKGCIFNFCQSRDREELPIYYNGTGYTIHRVAVDIKPIE